MRRLMAVVVMVAVGGVCARLGQAAAPDPPPVSMRIDLAGLPANTSVEVSQAQKPEAAFCSTWYLPATSEFFLWGKIGGHREESKRYEAQVLKLGDDTPEWTEAFPRGKEAAWADGKFPNWGCGCHRLRYRPDRPWLENAADCWIGGSAEINRVSFVEAEGIARPTRAYTHHQAAYDSKRDRLVYYIGGKTFAYDPQKRSWADLQAKPPLACEALAWASMAYDPVGDQIVLFGGAYALNPWGGARTWLFDCAKNEWRRAVVKDGIEPPLRCCTQLVYDSKNKVMVLFGGDALDRFLADTWVLDPATLTWTERKPEKSPPPLDHFAACFVEKHGLVLLVSPTQRGSRRPGAAWTYDTAKNVWAPLALRLPEDKPMEWISCAYSAKHYAVVLAAPGVGTWVCRLGPTTASDPKAEGEMVPPGSWTWNTRGFAQTRSILDAPPPDRAATEKRLKELPSNTVVDAEYPGLLISKTWSTATIDTDRGIVVYIGGGHSGYTGNDCALYNVSTNRWAFDSPPSFFPFLRNYNASLYGWDYQMRATSQHTYRWYCYDPASKLVVYCARPAGPRNGFGVLLEEDESETFVYDEKKHGYWTFLYDPVANKHFPPVFGRPFTNSWSMALVGTPKGVFAKSGGELYHGKAAEGERATIEWTLLDKGGPSGEGEFQPLIYDSKRARLIFVAAKKDQPLKVWEHPLAAGEWKELPLKHSTTRVSREIVYDSRSDSLLALAPEALLVMDFESQAWRELDVAVPKGLFGTECAMVYDPVHEVSVLLIPTSFSGKMRVGLFRYDPRSARYRQDQ